MKQTTKGHLTALLTMTVWGTTFISTKVLLGAFSPVEILVMRFVISLVVLSIAAPRMMRLKDVKHNVYFIGAGLSGICLYYLMENIALTLTTASNVGVLVTVAPFFTAIAAYIFLKGKERLTVGFFLGFIVAVAGVALISFNGSKLELNPLGDLLAIMAAAIWAVYSMCTRKIAELGYPTIEATRRMFLYGVIFMIPAMWYFDFSPNLAVFAQQPVMLFNILFLGVLASAICFASWNYAIKAIGVLKSSMYIYAGPVVTVVAAAIILHEKITPLMAIGTVLTMAGLIVSEKVKIKEL